MTYGKPLGNLGTEDWFLGTNLVINGLELSVPPLTSRKGREAEDSILSSVAKDLINHAYVMKPPKRPKFQRSSELVSIQGEWHSLSRSLA